MVTIGSRASWGARRPDGQANLSGLATEVFVHHTVTATLAPNATPATEHAQMRTIEDIGHNRFGTGISYNVIVFPSGRAYQGVSWNRRGTHTGGRNSTSRSICFAGNFETNQPTAAAIATAAAIYAHGRGRWWTTGAPLRGHREVSATACPGRHLFARLAEIRTGGGSVLPPPPPPEDEDMPLNQSDLEAIHRIVSDSLDQRVRTRHTSWVPAHTAGVVISQEGREELDRDRAGRMDERFTVVFERLDEIIRLLGREGQT